MVNQKNKSDSSLRHKEGSFTFLGFSIGVTDDLSDLPPGFKGIDLVAEYDHTEGDRSITGGYTYRGSLFLWPKFLSSSLSKRH